MRKLSNQAVMLLALSMLVQQIPVIQVVAKDTPVSKSNGIKPNRQLIDYVSTQRASSLPSQEEVLSGSRHESLPLVYTTTIQIPITVPVNHAPAQSSKPSASADQNNSQQDFEDISSTQTDSSASGISDSSGTELEIINEPEEITDSFADVEPVEEPTLQVEPDQPSDFITITKPQEVPVSPDGSFQTPDADASDYNDQTPGTDASDYNDQTPALTQPDGSLFESMGDLETISEIQEVSNVVYPGNSQLIHEIEFVDEPNEQDPDVDSEDPDNDALVPGLDDSDIDWDIEFIHPPIATKPDTPQDPEEPDVEPPADLQPGPTPKPGDDYTTDDSYDPNLPGLPFDSVDGSEVYYPSNNSMSNSFVIISPSADSSVNNTMGKTITIKRLNARSNRRVRVANMGIINLLPDYSITRFWKGAASPYNTPSLWGQCTWFAWGRFYELYGFDPGFSGNGYDCVSQLLAAHSDKFRLSKTPAAGALFSSDVAHNHVGIVLDYNEETDILTIQEGNIDQISNPDWEEAIRDYRTIRLTSADIQKLYGDVTYAVPKKDTKFVKSSSSQTKKEEKKTKTSGKIDADKVPLKQLTKGLVEKKVLNQDVSGELQQIMDTFQEFDEVVEK